MSIDWSKPIRKLGTKEPLKYRCWRYINSCPIRYVDCPVSCDTYFYFGNGQPYMAGSPMLENYEPEPEVENKPVTVDWSKPVQHLDGTLLRVLCTDAPGVYPVVTLTQDGGVIKYPLVTNRASNVPDKRIRYINIYNTGNGHLTREDADASARYSHLERVACIKVEYTVGQFDI